MYKKNQASQIACLLRSLLSSLSVKIKTQRNIEGWGGGGEFNSVACPRLLFVHAFSFIDIKTAFNWSFGPPVFSQSMFHWLTFTKSLIPSSFFKFCSLFPLFFCQKYLHVPFIEIWRQRAVAGCVVYCWGCWWYGAVALVLCGRWYYGGRCGGLVPWTGRWRWLRSWVGGFVDLQQWEKTFLKSTLHMLCVLGLFFVQIQDTRYAAKQIKTP